MSKTAMQELIEWIENERLTSLGELTLSEITAKATELLEKEKEQIAGSTSSSTVKELEREVKYWKEKSQAMLLALQIIANGDPISVGLDEIVEVAKKGIDAYENIDNL